jgi:hypothetical protein
MFLKFATSIAVAALLAPCLYMCIQEGRNQAAADAAHHLRGSTSSDPTDPNDFVRSWLRPYVAKPISNPDHKRAMVETLIRYGTTHVQRGINLEDVKDALAIEFLAQVDGKPVPIDGFDDTLFIGTIGEFARWRIHFRSLLLDMMKVTYLFSFSNRLIPNLIE